MDYFDLTYFTVTLIGFSIASYTDIKTHEINPKIPEFLIITGLLFHAIQSYLINSLTPLLLSIGMMLLAFAFSYALFLIGGWAGGDVKLFTALGAILPSYGKLNFFPFYSLAAALLAVFPFIIIYVGYHLLFVKGIYKKSKKILLEAVNKSIEAPFLILSGYLFYYFTSSPLLSILVPLLLYILKKPGFIISVILTVYYFYLNFLNSFIQFSYSFWITFLALIFISFYKIAKKHILRQTIPVTKLKEGDILAKNLIKQKNKYIFKENSLLKPQKNMVLFASASGLEKKDIKLLKKLGFKKIEVKKSIPFVPIFTLGIFLLWLIQTILY